MVGDRIYQEQNQRIRIMRGISEYELSYRLGHSKNYIHNIASGYSQPSLGELLYLLEILGVTPRDFFDEEGDFKNPILAKQIMDAIKGLDQRSLEATLLMVSQLKRSDKRYMTE